MRLASSVSASGWPPNSREAAVSSLSIPQTSLSRRSSAPASSDSRLTSTTGAAPSLKRLMSAIGEAAGQHDQAVVRSRRRGGEATQERAQALVLELARSRTGPVLQWFDAIENEKHAPPHQRLGDGLALGLAGVRLGRHAELDERPVKELVGRGRTLLSTLGCRTTSRARVRRRDSCRLVSASAIR